MGTDADGEVVLRSRESWSGRTLRAQGPDSKHRQVINAQPQDEQKEDEQR